MELTDKGAHAAQLGHRERHALGEHLMYAGGPIDEYIGRGICYDAVAFVRFLLGARITIDELLDTSGKGWRNKFNFERGRQWDGRSAIPHGTAIGFWRDYDREVFHAALAIGGTQARAINGFKLGDGWLSYDLKRQLTRAANGLFSYDNGLIRVYLSWI